MMKPYQERVVAERDELANKLSRLSEFLSYDNYHILDGVPNEEIGRLSKQLIVMKQYLLILNERIQAFCTNPAAAAE